MRPSLRELLNSRRILLNAAASDWREAVSLGGELLLRDGCITPHYIQAIQENIFEKAVLSLNILYLVKPPH